MKNPFSYTAIAKGDAFCNREIEQAELLTFIKGAQNILLYSHRRYGKSSLIFKLFDRLHRQRPKTGTLYIDLYGTLSEKDFVAAILTSLGQVETRIEKLAQLVRNTIQSVKLGMSLDPVTGSPGVSISFDATYSNAVLNNALGLLGNFAKRRKLLVVFDEFQEIANYRQAGFEKRLRAVIQQHGNISYIFCGSKRHILNEIFTSRNRAFYKLAQSYPLAKIETGHYIKWAQKLFDEAGRQIKADIISEIVLRCENHPMYVQQFLFYLWAHPDERISRETVEAIELKVLQASQNEFFTLWDSLTTNQKKTLKLIILTSGKDMFYASVLQSVELKAGSQVKRALEKLMSSDIVLKNGSYEIQDVMFKNWIVKFLLK